MLRFRQIYIISVFVDESGVNLDVTHFYGRGKIGERVVTNAPRNRGRNTSILGRLSLDGLVVSITVIGSTNKKIFEIYSYFNLD